MIVIRPARHEDARAILTAHYEAVHRTAAGDYDGEILATWSKPVDMDRIEKFHLNPDNEIRIVAEEDGAVLGFGAVMPGKNELRACYVHPEAGRRGVGRRLMMALEEIAREHGVAFLELDSSLTAEKFYAAHGYQVLSRGEHILSTGMKMACVKMRKELA